MTTYTDFIKDFFNNLLPKDAIFSGKRVTFPIGQEKIATIILSDDGYVDRHDKFNVTITSKTIGKIDGMTFNFNDHFHKRTDNRPDYKGSFYIWSKPEWYIACPTKSDINKLAKTIFNYINLYAGV